MANEQGMARRRLTQMWDDACGIFQSLQGTVQPAYGDQVFQLSQVEDGSYHYEVKPVVFAVPERPTSTTESLYIVMRGRLAVRAGKAREQLQTSHYATEVAYFRANLPTLDHVYGAHFDYDVTRFGHPVFHAQMKSYSDRTNLVKEAYRVDTALGKDYMEGVLRTARVPTAQMDPFAFILQLAADHLIGPKSPAEHFQLLKDLSDSLSPLRGISDLLQVVADAQCMRGVHWYAK